MTTIKLKNGSGAPLAGDLVQGEPALDLTNKRLYTEDSGGTVIEVGTNPTSLTTGTFTSTGIDDNAASTAITIDGSQNVGIGASSPNQKLHVYESSVSSQAYVTVQNNRTRNAAVLTQTTNGGFYTGTSIGTDTLCWQVYDSSAGERMRLDASGNVGIGCTPDAWSGYSVLQIGTAGCLAASEDTTFVTANAYSSATGWKYVTTDEASLYQQESGQHVWYGAASGSADAAISWSEAMRIDSNGFAMFGTTNTSPGSGNTDQGVTIRGIGDHRSFFSVSGDYVAAFNRNTNDGPIVEFNKNGTIVGSIGTRSSGSNLYIDTGESGIDFGGDGYLPMRNGSITDDSIDIGSDSNRYKDLYLSGGAYLGGTGSANKLDDYEEGTFTPTVTASSGTLTYTNQQGSYVKIGDVVYYWIRVVVTNSTTATLYNVESLPFSTSAYSNFFAGPTIGNAYNINLNTNGTVLGAYYINGSSSMRLHSYGNNTGQLAPSVAAGTSFEVRFEGHYRTTA